MIFLTDESRILWQLLRTFRELETLENISVCIPINRISGTHSWFLLGKSVIIRNHPDIAPISDVEDAENRIMEFRQEVEEINLRRSSRVKVCNVFWKQSATIVYLEIIITPFRNNNNDNCRNNNYYHNGIRYLMIEMTSLRSSWMIEWCSEVGVRSVSCLLFCPVENIRKKHFGQKRKQLETGPSLFLDLLMEFSTVIRDSKPPPFFENYGYSGLHCQVERVSK